MNAILFILAIFLLSLIAAHASTNCNRSCGTNYLQYPFGFSAGCKIQLNCSSDGEIFIGEFPVKSVNSNSIQINIEANCNRSLQTIHQLFGDNYAPTSRNTILLQNCSSSEPLPSIILLNQFVYLSCISNISNISYYTQLDFKKNGFLDYDKVTRSQCKYFLSSILTYSFYKTFEVEIVELGWWLDGRCYCSSNANCITFESPYGLRYQCKCKDGFEGDGYINGVGCRRGIAANLSVLFATAIGASVAGIAIILVLRRFCFRRIFPSNKSMVFWKKSSRKNRVVEAFMRNYAFLTPMRYSYSSIKKVTNSFRDKLGQGGYGSVYKGKLQDGKVVAVKVLNNPKSNGEEFINEVASISRTSHVNIVSLSGFCFEGSKRALLYEFMPNGSLEKFIYNNNSSISDRQLGWKSLYQISLGIARGLEYLHRGCKTQIVHFDIKPHNILLDENFCPKISDFGLAKLCPRTDSIISMTGARGTAGYIAPEVFYRCIGEVSHKSDVYSYGMMVLEMVGGRKNMDVGVDRTSEIYFPHLIYKRLELHDELGLQGIANEEDKELARKMIIVSLWCTQTNPLSRPPISEVVDMLEGSLESLQIPPKPFLSSPSRSPVDSSNTNGIITL